MGHNTQPGEWRIIKDITGVKNAAIGKLNTGPAGPKPRLVVASKTDRFLDTCTFMPDRVPCPAYFIFAADPVGSRECASRDNV